MLELEKIYAYKFALEAHGEQKRKYTNEGYIVHPLNVARILMKFGIEREYVLEAALLHDTIEDTNVVYEDLLIFGGDVADLVTEVTDISTPSDGNRKSRKEKDLEHLSKCSYYGAAIKMADLLDNTSSIIVHDKKFAKVYLQEKEQILNVLKEKGPKNLKEAVEYSLMVSKAQMGM